MEPHRTLFAAPVERALSRTQNLIDQFGGRLAGSEPCQKTAEALCVELRQICGNASFEAFTTHPGTFTGFYRIDVGLYLVGLAFLLFGQPLLAGLILTFMIAAAGMQFGWYIELYDRFYPLKTCHNLTAVLEPCGETHNQLILSAHHDSANELRFLKKNQKLYGLKILVPDAFRMTAAVFAWTWVGWQAVTGKAPFFKPWVLGFLILGIYFVFTKFFAFEPWTVPSAGDNLIASSMLVELANLLHHPDRPGQSLLAHTRLIFASFDAEEAGLRGSRAWVKAHQAELTGLPTFALNIDSIYNADDIQFMVTDLNDHIQLDRKLAECCQKISGNAGYPAKLVKMRFGGGATDATELTKAGVRATTMIAMPASIIREGLVYHTMKDTVDAIEPEAVSACMQVAYRLAQQLDIS